jgi:hypothetical protein
VFSHVWLLLIRTSSLSPVVVEQTLTALMFVSAAETLFRFLVVAVLSSWRDFLYALHVALAVTVDAMFCLTFLTLLGIQKLCDDNSHNHRIEPLRFLSCGCWLALHCDAQAHNARVWARM